MDVGNSIKKALARAFASLAVLTFVLMFALDMGKWMAALIGLLWLPWGLITCILVFAWFTPN